MLSQIATAQEIFTLQKRVVCGKPQIVFQEITGEEYKEKMYWTGSESDNSSLYILTMNQKTGTWTLIQLSKQLACVLGSGIYGKSAEPAL